MMNGRTKAAAVLGAAVLCGWVLVGMAGAAAPAKVEPVLRPDEALGAKVEALAENTWMKLPRFKVAGELKWLSPRADERTRGPFARSYCNHAVWMPERKRALYCGGGHNVRPINDVWEYDLAANTWYCLRGADPPFRPTAEWFRKNAKLKDGILMTRTGAPIRMSHTWDQFTYDPHRRLAIYVHSGVRNQSPLHRIDLGKPGNAVAKGLGLTAEKLAGKLCKDGIYVWGFDPAKRKWTHVEFMVDWKGPGNTIGGRQESGILEYMPGRKTLWFLGYGGPLIRDPATGKWKRRPGKRTYGGVGVYVPQRRCVVIVAGRKTRICSVDTNEFKTVQTDAAAHGTDASCSLHWDGVARRVVMYTSSTTPHLWLYDPAANRWTDPKPAGDVPPGQRLRALYYDPARNVLVCYNSRDMWVYRCKKRPPRPAGR